MHICTFYKRHIINILYEQYIIFPDQTQLFLLLQLTRTNSIARDHYDTLLNFIVVVITKKKTKIIFILIL